MKKTYIIPSLDFYCIEEETLLTGSGGDHNTSSEETGVTPPDVNEDPDTPPPYIPGGPSGSAAKGGYIAWGANWSFDDEEDF